ncbi:glycoside hydrolase family 32 protein [Cohnella sp. CFH 77786]|uniref:glycoside hydrolase family 32 protein n=1 Tax=Cohnella sp. CFH 77786 TaxID=2662265 RepID=UPI001C60F699|nr:glycoside hydrolase family 32 protein [Cohnella sp. CFH 77786]MBW5447589.1 glycoside hydrolase family 32 protein [Cohnella sp. CFH 77786]
MSAVRNTEKYRPRFHFTPPANWMNDPNGLVYFNGEYHLFYQHYPHGTKWGPMHWGHAVSRDLMTWEHLPVALAPDEKGMIFSGSAVVDWHDTTGFFGGQPGLVAIFTHHEDQQGAAPRQKQSQSLAYSRDSGRTWVKFEGNPVLGSDEFADFRDPKVFWHPDTRMWVMILACGRTVRLYRSPNLKEWSFCSEFGHGIGSHDGVWECPDLFELPVDGDRGKRTWVMLVSIANEPGIPEGSRTQYFTGQFDGNTFVPDEASRQVRWIDYGRDNYAGVSWSDIPEEDGRRIYVGWMNNWKYADATPTESWRGAMTIPRELALETRNREVALIQRPVKEWEAQRALLFEAEGKSVGELNAQFKEHPLETYEIEAEFELAEGIEALGFKLRTSASEETVVGCSVKDQAVFVDRTRSGAVDFHELFPGRHQASLQPDLKRLHLRIIVDQASVEVFANDGQIAITDLIYPSPDSLGLSLFCEGEGGLSYRVKMYKPI